MDVAPSGSVAVKAATTASPFSAYSIAVLSAVCAYARLRSATNGVIAATSVSSKAPISADMGVKALFFNSSSSYSVFDSFRIVPITLLTNGYEWAQKSVSPLAYPRTLHRVAYFFKVLC